MRDARDLEQRYRELEGRREVTLATKVRRGQIGLLLALLISVLLAGVTGAVDLRRLQTPVGTAQAWAEATVAGDCPRHLELSVAGPAGAQRRADLCAALRTATLRDPPRTVRTRLLEEDGRTAATEVVVVRERSRTVARVPLRRDGDDWLVVRDAAACRVGCS